MQKIKFCLLAIVWPAMSVLAQPVPPPVHALKIGDIVPDIEITHLYNYPRSSVRLPALKGKLTILDFWSTWCTACIEAFPKMHSLQKEFGEQLQVFLIDTYKGDDIKKVTPLFEKQKTSTGKGVTLPYSLLQASLTKYFPYRYVPHYVWISKEGKVMAITSQIEVTKENIAAVIAGREVNLHMKNDQLDFDHLKPLFVNGNGGDGNEFMYRSIMTKYIEGLGNESGNDQDSNHRFTRFYALNIPALLLLSMAYPDCLNHPTNRIIIEARDKARYLPYTEGSTESYTKSFCYEIIFPPCGMEEMWGYVKQDLYRLLHVTVRKEERNMPCWVLNAGEKIPYTKGGDQVFDIDKNSRKNYIQNEPVSALLEVLNSRPAMKEMPVVDESGISRNIDLELPKGFFAMSQDELKLFLEKNGFKVSEDKRKMEVGIIADGMPPDHTVTGKGP